MRELGFWLHTSLKLCSEFEKKGFPRCLLNIVMLGEDDSM